MITRHYYRSSYASIGDCLIRIPSVGHGGEVRQARCHADGARTMIKWRRRSQKSPHAAGSLGWWWAT